MQEPFTQILFCVLLGLNLGTAAHVQASRRPTDGRYGEHPNRNQHFYQYQVVLKPSPLNIQDLYLDSLKTIGIDPLKHDIRFVEDNWESPTLGASGIGWEVWLDGMEITQFTYFQQVGGLECKPVMGEIAYGIERLAMTVQGVSRIRDLVWTQSGSNRKITYGDIFLQNEFEMTRYNFEEANVKRLFALFDLYEEECNHLIAHHLPLPAYEMVLKASHTFNLLDARRAISVSERQRFILRVRTLARQVAELYYEEREKTGFPLKNINTFNASVSITDPSLRAQRSNPEKSEKSEEDSMSGLLRYARNDDQGINADAKTKDLLIEIGVEELPPKNLEVLSRAFEESLAKGFNNNKLSFTGIETFITPRRIAAIVHNLVTIQPPQIIVKRGLAKSAVFDDQGKYTPQALAFAKACGTEVDKLEIKDTDKGPCLVYEYTKFGISTEQLIPSIVTEALQQLPLPKRMRWGDRSDQFIRPVHWWVLLFGNTTINAEIFGIHSGNATHGHRFHHPESITLKHPSEYQEKLQQGKVMVDFSARKKSIQDQLQKAAEKLQGEVLIEPELLDQVTGLVEWPVVLIGNFDKNFLTLPKEVLMTSMKVHQKTFPLLNKKGELLPYFLIVSNLESQDPQIVIKGNERVMDARLRDAEFYYQIDQKSELGQKIDLLRLTVFQKGLGSLWDKSDRIKRLGELIFATLAIDPSVKNYEDSIPVARAALLCKTDLTTQMVGEFPELQGIIGRHYATLEGEPETVAIAIEEHYLPRFANDALPQTLIGIIIALADRIDTLVGLFGLGKRPAGDKDPFGLRRQALAILRILIEKELNLDLGQLLVFAKERYGEHLSHNVEIIHPLVNFCLERLRVWYQDQGVSGRIFDAIVARQTNHENFHPLDFHHRVHAVTAILKTS